MKVLSFDVGVKNLAYCLLDYDAATPLVDGAAFPDSWRDRAAVVDWQVVVATAAKRPSVAETTDGVYARLDEIHEAHGLPDIVLIESQPCMRNPTMKSVQMMLYCYYVMRARLSASPSVPGPPCRVSFVNAQLKLTGLCAAKDYRARKRASVDAAAAWLADRSLVSQALATKKKDDLADSLLQALQWLRREHKD